MALYPCGSSNGGGGGSTVVPNPTGEAVGELTSIGIDGSKYSISGGGGAYTTTVLFTNGASGDTTFQLSSAYTNFDAIAIYYSHFDGQDSYEDVRTYPTSFLNSVSSTDEVLGFTNDAWYYYFSVYSTTEFRYVKSNAGYITDIIGIKYGSNSGGGAVTGVKGSAESTYRTGNVDISASNIGLGNVDNTADLNKPISTATQTALNGKVNTSSVGSANGVAELDANGRVPSSQLPSYVDDVLEYADLAHFPATGETGKIYIADDTNKTYRWSGSGYAEISESLALGETSSTAYAGNKGKANADAISAIKDGTNIDSFGDVETALSGKANSSDLGDKSNLTTTDKSSCVGAINEVNTVATESITALSVSGLTLTWLDNVPDAHKAIRVGNLVIVNVGLDIDGTFTGTTGWTLLFSYPDSLLNSGESFIKPYFTSMMCMDRQDYKIYPSLVSGNQIWLDSTISLYHLTVRGQMILPIVKS